MIALALALLLAGPAPAAESAKAPQRFLSPARRDGVNDFAAFGPDAAEVSIADRAGRLVFRAVKRDAAPLVWDGRDGAGRLREPGVYFARIRTRAGAVLHQTFVLVR